MAVLVSRGHGGGLGRDVLVVFVVGRDLDLSAFVYVRTFIMDLRILCELDSLVFINGKKELKRRVR